MLEFDLARNALRYLVSEYKIKEVYIPYYLCNVVRNALVKENCKPLFYHIDDNFMPIIEFSKEAYILYPNYFGICEKNIQILEKKYSKLIVDNAHSYYSDPSGFASFNAGHKWNENYKSYLFIGKEEFLIELDSNRRQLFNYYHLKYSNSNLLNIDININAIPFCYPYLAKTIDEADSLAKELHLQGKTIYRYWDALPESYNEYKFYRRLVPIPLD